MTASLRTGAPLVGFGMPHFMINREDAPSGRPAGSLMWSGLANLFSGLTSRMASAAIGSARSCRSRMRFPTRGLSNSRPPSPIIGKSGGRHAGPCSPACHAYRRRRQVRRQGSVMFGRSMPSDSPTGRLTLARSMLSSARARVSQTQQHFTDVASEDYAAGSQKPGTSRHG
jgi:hypothetical protein